MIIASYILHYGQEWLKWSIRSVVQFVDRVDVFYTPFPSHGFSTTLQCPETKMSIGLSIADLMAEYPTIFWHDCGRFAHEGYHRTHAVNECAKLGADIVLVVDADELWDPDLLQQSIEIVGNGNIHSYRINMMHFWKSLKWVCNDPAMPTRFVKPFIEDFSEEYLSGKVYHMGYAQSESITIYKQSVHGHKNEWRAKWFEGKFCNWKPGNVDVHPTCEDYWTPETVTDELRDNLAKVCRDHPYWDLDLIA